MTKFVYRYKVFDKNTNILIVIALIVKKVIPYDSIVWAFLMPSTKASISDLVL